jgi:hypothetical protein
LRSGRVDSSTADTNFLTEGGLWTGRVYGNTGDSAILTVGWLHTSSVFTLGDVDVSTCVLSALVLRTFDVNVVGGLVFSTTIGNLEVDMS